MRAGDFFAQFGFSADPLESTNAENEPRLADYFVPPPYFVEVLGDPLNPHPDVVFAPRGSGKTAQRRMVEDQSAAGQFLCITYDAAEQPPGFTLDQASWAYHMNQICRRILVGVLLAVEEDRFLVDALIPHQRQLLKFQLERFLGPLSVQEFGWAVSAIKSFGDKANDFWNRYGGPIAAALNILMNKSGLDKVNVPLELAEQGRADESLRYHFENLLDIARAVGFGSTYILVDKVDETPLTTNDAAATFEYIRALVTDLPTLEAAGVGFKFFLWDRIEEAFRTGGGRPDRVQVLTLNWSVVELTKMLQLRLAAFSDGRITSLNELLCAETTVDFHRLVTYLAAGSPRDMIRAAKAVVNEATRTTVPPCIEEAAVWGGIRRFAEQRTRELFPTYLPDLKKVGEPSFTLNHLANDIFHVTHQAARNKVQNWMNAGLVEKIGEVPNPPNRPLHLYGILDLRVAITASTAMEVPLALDNFAVECPTCKEIVITAESRVDCPHCGNQFQFPKATSLLALCTRPE